MQLARYLDLYLSETHEHLRVLNRAILELETAGGGGPVDEAFRAAHTIKGMAATMGFDAVSAAAHALEDRLAEVRTGARAVDTALIDALLHEADRLEQEVAASAALPLEVEQAGPGAAGSGGGARGEAKGRGGRKRSAAAARAAGEGGAEISAVAAPPGTALIARIALAEHCLLKAARATMVLRKVAELAPVLGTDPAALGEDWDGRFRLFVGGGADREAVEAAIRAAGDVESVALEAAAAGPEPAAESRGAPGGAEAARPASGRAGAEAPTPGTGRFLRVDQRHLDDLADGMGDLAVVCGDLERVARAAESEALAEVLGRVLQRVDDLRHTVLALRMAPVGDAFNRFPRVVRDAARSLGKEVDFRMEGREIGLDREILDEVVEPIIHLLRNAVDHGIEPPAAREAAGKPPRGRLVLRAVRERAGVLIQVEDDGRGISRVRVLERARALGLASGGEEELSDEDLLRLLSQPGFSTTDRVTDLSGRGVGLDAVVNRIRLLGGAVGLQSAEGEGSTFSLRLPVTLALSQALRVRVGGEDYAIPLTHVSEAAVLEEASVGRGEGGEWFRLRGEELELVRLGEVLQVPERGEATAAVIVELGERRAALAVDELVGREQIVVKGFDAAIGTLPVFSGVTLLADGRPALVLDPISVF